jgi:ribosome maturation factor RimP
VGWQRSPFFLDFMADIFALTQEALAGMDIEVIDVERAALGLLRVTIDRPDGIRVEDCEQASKQLSRVFEVENIDYKRLEVGSPGTDRPLKKISDFVRYAGFRVEIRLREAVDNRKVFVGVLQVTEPTDNPVFGLAVEATAKDAKTQPEQLLRFSFDDVDRAKLDPILDFKGNKR